MSKHHDDRTFATNPGRLRSSEEKLRKIEPELSAKDREHFDEHLHLGASSPAIVVSKSPLVVAALAGDLDAAILVSFPEELAAEHGLDVGSRLLGLDTARSGKPSLAGTPVAIGSSDEDEDDDGKSAELNWWFAIAGAVIAVIIVRCLRG